MPKMATFETIGYEGEFDYLNVGNDISTFPENLNDILLIMIFLPFLLCGIEIWNRKKIYHRFGMLRLFVFFIVAYFFSIYVIFTVKNFTQEDLSVFPCLAVLYVILFLITTSVSSTNRKQIFKSRLQALAQRDQILASENGSKELSDIIHDAKQFLSIHLRKKMKDTPISIQKRLELEQIALYPYFVEKLLRLAQEKGYSERMISYVSLVPIGSIGEFRFKNYTHKFCRPSKIGIFNYILGLRLNITETRELLKSAGYELSSDSKFDILMEYIIQQHLYDIVIANEILRAFHCPLLKIDRVTFQLSDGNS